ncbi:hypothetical protein RFI_13532 [Reticulomyxa filosa]|uniref:DH domain-containing protein n=1 Tax=Reticulomyxa filosa TaxID=46433 RepID=X6ND00_RETFI|nr:hypothetical protein RFI_13532 [Reticulomyxa filosa]|eukprot:ETO23649.1 hypothetical protein RFI_13532 [Reticulomyxa filosa]
MISFLQNKTTKNSSELEKKSSRKQNGENKKKKKIICHVRFNARATVWDCAKKTPPPPPPANASKENEEKKEDQDEKEQKRQRNRQKVGIICGLGEERIKNKTKQKINKQNEIKKQTYCDQLTVLTELYVLPLKNNGILKENQHSVLFPDIQTISGLNQNLLSKKLKSWDNSKSRIGDEFIKFAPYFKMYQKLWQKKCEGSSLNVRSVRTKIKERLISVAFFAKKIHKTKQKKPNSFNNFVPNNKRIREAKELLKLTNEDHPDYNDIQNTLKQISSVNMTINTRMKDFSSREQVKQVEQRFGVSPARHYIREGYLNKVCRKKDRRYLFFLFKDPFDRHFRIEDIQNNRKYGSLCFEIHSTVKSFLVVAENLAEKNGWVEDIKGCVSYSLFFIHIYAYIFFFFFFLN